MKDLLSEAAALLMLDPEYSQSVHFLQRCESRLIGGDELRQEVARDLLAWLTSGEGGPSGMVLQPDGRVLAYEQRRLGKVLRELHEAARDAIVDDATG